MTDDIEDPYAFIIDNCRYSSSQEHSNFARGNEIDFGNLGFPGERNGSLELNEKFGPGDEQGVDVRPFVEYGEIDGSETVFDVRVKVIRPLRCVTPSGVECSGEQLGFEGKGDELENCTKRKKLDFGDNEDNDTVVIEFEGGEENVAKDGEDLDTESVNYVDMEGFEVEGSEQNVAGIEGVNDVDTEVIEVEEGGERVRKNEEVLDTEVIEVGEEAGEGNVAELSYVDTEVIEDEVGEERVGKNEGVLNTDVIEVGEEDKEGNVAEFEGVNDVDTGVIEDEGAKERVGKNDGVLDTEVIEVGEEGGKGNCVKIGGVNYVDTETIEFDEEGENCENLGVHVEMVEVVEEEGNREKVDGQSSNVDTEEIVVVVEEEQRKEDENGKDKVDEEDALRGDGMRKRMSEEGIKKRKLPRSMFEQWGVRVENGEGCSKDTRLEGNAIENEKTKDGSVGIRCILDALKLLVGEMSGSGDGDSDDGGKVDFLETAKRRGMTFPPPRFRP